MRKIFTLKVLTAFYDTKSDHIRRLKNTQFECSKKRAIEILNHELKLVEILSIKNVISNKQVQKQS